MSDIPLGRKNFQRIIQFYLFECPVATFERKIKQEKTPRVNQKSSKYDYTFKQVSKRGCTFHARGIYGPKLNSFRAAMQKVAKVDLISVVTEEEVIEPEHSGEYIVARKKENSVSVTEGYFYLIRNAFAHGEFEVVEKTYIFQNTKNGKLSGIAKLKEDTLLKWIDLFNMPIDEIQKINSNKNELI